MKITKSITLAKILEQKGAEAVLLENGVPCMSCPYSAMEMDTLKIGEVCKMYGLNLEKILKSLNNNGKKDA
jgi:hypothetical protein